MAEGNRIEVLIQGADENGEILEASAKLAALPRVGEQIGVWIGGRIGEEYLEVAMVTHPSFQYDHDPGPIPPTVSVRRSDVSDEQWADVFKALHEKRVP